MIRALFDVPAFSHVDGDFRFFQNGAKSEVFQFELADIENADLFSLSKSLADLIKSLESDQRVVFKVRKQRGSELPETSNVRFNAIKDVGYTKYTCALFINTDINKPLFPWPKKPVISHDSLNLDGLQRDLQLVRVPPGFEPDDLCFEKSKIIDHGSFLDFGDHCLGGVCVINKSEHFSPFELAKVLAELPYDTEFVCGVTRLSLRHALQELDVLKNRQASFGGFSKTEKIQDIMRATNALELEGDSLLKIEQFVLCKAPTEKDLRLTLGHALKVISPLGETLIETAGLTDLMFASLPGGRAFHSFHDISSNLLSYVPVLAFKSNTTLAGNPVSSLVLHRPDWSLEYFDQFNPKYKAYSSIIVGTTGSGKSVLTNMLTQSLHSSPEVQIVKVDVGGSYTKECQALSGTEYELSIDKPTGLNPFSHVAHFRTIKSYQEYLTHFLCELIKESDEVEVTKSLRGEIEEAVSYYLALNRNGSSITDFYEHSGEFSRKELLKRWIKGGLYEHTFSGSGLQIDSKYAYFNFKSVLAAGSKDFSQAVMAAVILELNLKIYQAGNRFDNPNGLRIILVFDETKFFLERNRNFFLFTVSNFRKLGHGVIIINQDINNFVFTNSSGESDNSLINNSPIRFFLQALYSENELVKSYGLSPFQIDRILKDPYKGKDYREFVLQDDIGTRVCRLKLTPEEYYASSTTTEDNQKIANLMRAVPGLTFREAIRCITA